MNEIDPIKNEGEEITTIKVRRETRNLLKEFARKSETYDDVIRRLLNIARGSEKRDRPGYYWNPEGGYYSGSWDMKSIPICFKCHEELVVLRGLSSKGYVHRVWAVCQNENCRARHLLKIPLISIDKFMELMDVEVEDWRDWKKRVMGW